MKTFLWLAAGLVAMGAAAQATAETQKHQLAAQANFTHEQALKGQAWLETAMTAPMSELLRHAEVTNPEGMMEYGLALELGRPSASSQLSQGEKDKLKSGYRDMLDLYLNSTDKKDPFLSKVDFTEDAMLDNQEFWVDLAKQIGRRPQRAQLNMDLPGANGESATGMMAFLPDPQDEQNGLNLSQDLILRRGVVNAATACAESAAAFAKTRKAQLIAISDTRLAPDAFAKARADAVKTYRIAYAEGIEACGSDSYFTKVAAFAGQHLGALGRMKEDPAAQLASLKVSREQAAAEGDAQN